MDPVLLGPRGHGPTIDHQGVSFQMPPGVTFRLPLTPATLVAQASTRLSPPVAGCFDYDLHCELD